MWSDYSNSLKTPPHNVTSLFLPYVEVGVHTCCGLQVKIEAMDITLLLNRDTKQFFDHRESRVRYIHQMIFDTFVSELVF